ncbi:MAG: glutamate-5-semialdehyde dehydrogenase [Gemmatimonadota bacterium]
MMETKERTDLEGMVTTITRSARRAGHALARSTAEQREDALERIADAIEGRIGEISAANAVDLAAADERGISGPMRDRLVLQGDAITALAEAVREVARQPDPLGGREEETVRPNGLRVARVRIPIGVVAMIYESRPNVTVDAAVLCLKAGNAIVLRGGSEALHTNRALADVIQGALASSELPVDAVQLIPVADRGAVGVLLQQEEDVDLVIPRGGEGLIRAVTSTSRIPVLQHYKGVCHVFLDATAPTERAVAIARNAKVQRPGVCNAMETLLVHEAAAERVMPAVASDLLAHGVELRVCPKAAALLAEVGPTEGITPAEESDWGAEFLDLIVAVRVVTGLDEAIEHIAEYGSNHTEAIVTEDEASAAVFVRAVQSSTVLVNASTRFADGGALGLGAEIGISTSKLHAYGPMGARELTTRKFVVLGEGQVRA